MKSGAKWRNWSSEGALMGHSRSSAIAIRWSAYDFLFDFNRNCAYRFRDIAGYLSPAFGAPAGVTPIEFCVSTLSIRTDIYSVWRRQSTCRCIRLGLRSTVGRPGTASHRSDTADCPRTTRTPSPACIRDLYVSTGCLHETIVAAIGRISETRLCILMKLLHSTLYIK